MLGASVILLLILLYGTAAMGQISQDRGAVQRQSLALNLARLELEREIARATADGSAYQELVQQAPEVILPAPDLFAGELRLRRSQRLPTLFDIEVQLTWTQPGGARERTALFTSIWKR